MAQSCPFTSPRFKDLKAASAKLASALAESPDCQADADELSRIGTNISSLTQQAEASETDPNSTDTEKQAIASHLVSSFGQVNTIFNSRCGARLRNFLDYSEAFVDTVNGLSPYLALYAGPSAGPWVLGTALGGALLKTFITYIRGRGIDMTLAAHRESFITHSCSFYNLNQILKSIENAETFGLANINDDLERARSRRAELERIKPEKPNTPIIQDLDSSQKIAAELSELKKLLAQDPGIACLMIQDHVKKIRESDPNALGSKILSQFRSYALDNSAQARWKVKYFEEIELPELTENFTISATAPEDCKERATIWLSRFESFNGESTKVMKAQLQEMPNMKNYVSWENQTKALDQDLKILEKRRDFILGLSQDGGAFDISEIISNRDEAQDLLFDKMHMLEPVLAWQWLKFKREEAVSSNKEAGKLAQAIDKRLRETQAKIGKGLNESNLQAYLRERGARSEVSNNVIDDLCAQISFANSKVYASDKHVDAAYGYCVAFSGTINERNFGAMHKICFKESSKSSLKNIRSGLRDSNSQLFEYFRQITEEVGCRNIPDADYEGIATYSAVPAP